MTRACDNPFAVHRVLRQRYRLDAHAWAQLLAQLEAQKWRGTIVGPHGAGKTTLLEDLGTRLAENGWRVKWVRLSRESPRIFAHAWDRLAWLDGRDFVLLDGAEQLGITTWWRVRWQTRRAGGLVITAHTAGRLPAWWQCATSPALLQSLVTDLGVAMDDDEARALHARHGGNVRDALRELYDRVAAEQRFQIP